MDTPATESTGPLSLNQAASLFAGPEAEQENPADQAEPAKEPVKEPEQAEPDEPEQEEQDDEPAVEKVTIEVDGKTIELTKAELAEHYKNGLRQEDYTRKTMAAAEQRKAAEAETAKARAERQQYAQGLQQAQAVLQAAFSEDQKTDWHALRESDPVEFLRRQHLSQERQAAFQQNQQRLQQLGAMEWQERVSNFVTTVQAEQQEILAKLPEWKDEKKASADKKQIAEDLLSRGFAAEQVFGKPFPDGTPNPNAPGITDHKLLLLARDAMLYRKMMSKAKAAADKVGNLPQKVERPGGGETNATDGRTTAAMKRLNQSGSLRDAAAVFDKLFS